MKIILREDVHGLGNAGTVVSVRPGYARNFLLPEGKAVLATEAGVKELDHHQRVIAEKVAREMKTHQAVKSRLEGLKLSVAAQVGEEGKLFGSVTAREIAELIAAQGVEIDRRTIQLVEPIKEAGTHTIAVRLHREVTAQVKVEVTAANPPAEGAAS
ncbi:MAG TPA: 50S ribosomal protein L9 [Myxococcota bacterium]|nr:50S ribosomal protein L9 [Myxococcota bacterium]